MPIAIRDTTVVTSDAANRFVYSPALAEKTLRGVDDVISAWHGAEKGRITCVVAAHAPEACSPRCYAPRARWRSGGMSAPRFTWTRVTGRWSRS